MELHDYLHILRKNWIVLLTTVLVGVGLAAAYSLTTTPKYEAQSTVFASSDAGGTIAELQQGATFTKSRVPTYVGLVTTPIVLDPVIDKLGLTTTSAKLAASVTAASPSDTTLITITVENTNPALAADISNALAESLTTVVETLETTDTSAVSPVRLTAVSPATVPSSPSSPNVPLYLVLGGLIGLVIGLVIAIIRAMTDTRIRSPRDLELVTDRPLIGVIPFDRGAKSHPLVVHDEPVSDRAESYRTLRTNLQFLDVGERASFVVTSSVAYEGRTITSLNLAIALADAGSRVALLDTDLRNPMIAEYLGIEAGAGLTDVLIGRATLAQALRPWGDRELFVLPAGDVPPNPSELLGSQQMQTVIDDLEADFDVVLCDSPPILSVTDAAILARATSGAIMVVSADGTTRHQLAGALDALDSVGARVAGVIHSMVPTHGPDAYGTAQGRRQGRTDAAPPATRSTYRKGQVVDGAKPADPSAEPA